MDKHVSVAYGVSLFLFPRASLARRNVFRAEIKITT